MESPEQNDPWLKRKAYNPAAAFLRGRKQSHLVAAAGVLAAALGGLIILNTHTTAPKVHDNFSITIAPVATTTAPSPFASLHLDAKSVIVWDIRSQKALFERNADTVRPLASLTKIMTAITATDLVPRNTVVTINPEFLAVDGDSGLFVNESWKLGDLLNYSLVMSSNDGASAIAAVAGSSKTGGNYDTGAAAFVQLMNAKARAIGLPEMKFINPTGLDEASSTGGLGSARDVAKLFQYAIANYPGTIEATRYGFVKETSLSNIVHRAANTNEVIDSIPDLIASKTGYTDASGGNLAVVFDAGLNHPIAVVVLDSTYDGRFSDVDKLVGAAQEYISIGDAAPTLANKAAPANNF